MNLSELLGIDLTDGEWTVFQILVLLLLPASIHETSMFLGTPFLSGYGEVILLTLIGLPMALLFKFIDDRKQNNN